MRLANRTLCVNLRIYPIVGVNQRSMRVWHAAGLKTRYCETIVKFRINDTYL